MKTRWLEFAPGMEVAEYSIRPGDFILTHNNGLTSKLIRWGQGIRKWGDSRQFARWNHAALVVSWQGDLIEALPGGIRRTHLSKYKNVEYHYVPVDTSWEARQRVIKFADAMVGHPYAWPTFVAVAFSLLTGVQFNFGFDGQFICSGLVARALERTDAIFPRETSHMLPADLAEYFNVRRSNVQPVSDAA